MPEEGPVYGTKKDILICLDNLVVQPSCYCALGFANIKGPHKVTHWMPMPKPPCPDCGGMLVGPLSSGDNPTGPDYLMCVGCGYTVDEY